MSILFKLKKLLFPNAAGALKLLHKHEQSWLFQALDKLPKPLFILNLESKQVVFSNEAAKKILGLSSSEFDPTETYRRKYYQAIDPLTGQDIPAEQMPTSRMLRGEEVRGTEIILRSGAGEFHLKIFSAKLPKSYGQPASALILFQDITDLKKAEAKLVDTREIIQSAKNAVEHERDNFRSLFRETPEMVCILSGPEHLFTFVNEAHQRVLGFDATGKTVREAQPDSVEIFQILDDVYATGKTAELFEIPVTVGGRLRYFNLTYSARKDFLKRIDGIMILGTEVTDEVLAREGFKLQCEALTLALNDAPISEVLVVLCLMIERQTNGILSARIRLSGQQQNPTESDSYNQHEADDHWSIPIKASGSSLLATLTIFSKTKRKLSENEERIINLTAQTTALILGRKSEISERIVSSMALAESETELKFTLDSARMGTWKIDFTRGGVVTLSSKAQEIFGANEGYELPGDAISDFIHPDDREHATQVLTKTLQEGVPYEDTYRVLLKTGQVRWVELRGRARYSEDKTILMLTGLVMDVTERKKSEEMLQLSKYEADRANEAKSQFLANMSHEIRTPLGAIIGFTGLLKDESLTKDDREKFLLTIERNSNQLLRIIDDILDLSKVEAGMMLVEKIDFSLIDMLRDFSSLMGFKAREKGILLTMKATTDLPKIISSDPTRIRQILLNVVGNAIKFTDYGQVEIRVSFKDGLLQFEVEDSGRGISKEQEQHLFLPFSQGDPSITRKYGGTGLGLVLSRKLANALGGQFILKESQVGVGSVFVAVVPVHVKDNTEHVSVSAFEKAPLKSTTDFCQLTGLRALVVEDSPDNQALISIYLSKSGAVIDMASDGLQGYEMATTNEYDLVLMDVQMPVMDGITAIKKLRADGYQKVVIALTAHAMKEERVRCIESGFTDFIPKPINRAELIDTLRFYRSKILNNLM